MKHIFLQSIFVLMLIFFLSGCVGENNFKNVNNNIKTTDNEEILKIIFFTEKDTYELEDPFNLTLDIEYNEEPFKAAIIYDLYREKSNKHLYKKYIETISSKGLNHSEGHAGYPKMAFAISNKGSSSSVRSFFEEGTYVFSIFVYQCSEISKEGYFCKSGISETYLDMDKKKLQELIEKIQPFAYAEKRIIVKGGSVECKEDSDCANLKCDNCVIDHERCEWVLPSTPRCLECRGEVIFNGQKTYCKEGFTCKGYKCVEDPLYCKDDSDCGLCDGCKEGRQYCDRMQQCKDCDWSDWPCEEGYICEDWGCTSIEVLKDKKDCKTRGVCGTSDKLRNPEISCTFSSNLNRNQKCLECKSEGVCIEGYHCYNYECVPD